ncbi:hypothetical protein chiPu_0023528, partial [Chiloscyllium punctatum]|nr:hypothetical protein [Chiloscyllium punctatum]
MVGPRTEVGPSTAIGGALRTSAVIPPPQPSWASSHWPVPDVHQRTR